jgi:hypothetical protein
MRKIAEARRALRPTQRAMKSNAAIATAGIITFGSEAAQMFERLSQEQQDQAFLDLARAVAKRLGTSLHGLVIHLDEATIHAHFTLCAYSMEGVPLSNATQPAVLSELQDMTAEVMQRYCPEIERGTRYGDRMAAGADWADVVHKSVKELHRELPADLAAKRAALAELAAEEDASQERVAAIKAQITDLTAAADRISAAKQAEAAELTASLAGLAQAEENARARAAEMQARVDALTEKEHLTDKEVKRLETYQNRLTTRIAELEDARAKADAGRAIAQEKAAQAARDLEAEQAKVVAAAEFAAEETARAEAASQRAEAMETGLSALVREVRNGTIGTDDDGILRVADADSLRPAFTEIRPVVDAAVELSDTFRAMKKSALAAQAVLDKERAELAAERDQLRAEWTAFNAMRRKFGELLDCMKRWILRDDMPEGIADEGFAILTEADALWRGRTHGPRDPS